MPDDLVTFGGVAIMLLGMIGVWTERRILRLIAIAAFVGMALFVYLQFASDFPRVALVALAAKAITAWVVLLVMSGLVVRFIFPRLEIPRQRNAVAILTAGLLVAHLVAAVFQWREADNFAQLPNVPVATTSEEILALFDGPTGPVLYGVLTAARLAGTPGDTLALLEYGPRRCSVIERWPIFLPLVLADGVEISASFLPQRFGTWNWPAADNSNCAISLRAGNSVVFWSDVGALVPVFGPAGTRRATLNQPRLVAYGDIESFRATFQPLAVKAGEFFVVFAGVMALQGLWVLAMGLLAYYRPAPRVDAP